MKQEVSQGTAIAQDLLHIVLAAAQGEGQDLQQVLEGLPAPIYVTDPQGVVTHFNQACIAAIGRVPRIGEDVCCITWRLRTPAGDIMPNNQCPMATALREKRPIRDVEAVAERPDGTSVTFMTYPTPILGPDGTLTGMVNLLLDVTDPLHARGLRAQAEQCLRLVKTISDRRTAALLMSMAAEYTERALAIEASK